MGKRGANKDRSAIVVAIIAIILIIIMGVTAGQREEITVVEKWVGNIISPVQQVINTGVTTVGDGFISVFSVSKIKRENDELRSQVEELESEVITTRLNRDELEELRELRYALNFLDEEAEFDTIVADVIGKTPGNWFNTFTINAGEQHGISNESIIVASNGLVGRVFETGGNWAKVVSIIDNNSSVSFQVLRDGDSQGIVSGSISNDLTGYLFDAMADVVIGDKLITSGLGTFPRGIPIGEVVDVSRSADQLLKTITVEPAVNFKRIRKVMVMTPNFTYEQ
ncbi:rod shape-determining protein MreC [Alkaliphilus transvaalensis]|uniref:rod shape-determining protein MreC n=1 Tax=Alkaliphilus transvaalensis TaxID=114628 RepID=UPI00047D6CE6|nr:rod shape-determining protein MreC [Alkaliphilus transvaalensis]